MTCAGGLYAQLTASGHQVLQAARPTHYRGIRRHFLDRLDATDQIALGRICERLGAAG
jgi:hypothetical protein